MEDNLKYSLDIPRFSRGRPRSPGGSEGATAPEPIESAWMSRTRT